MADGGSCGTPGRHGAVVRHRPSCTQARCTVWSGKRGERDEAWPRAWCGSTDCIATPPPDPTPTWLRSGCAPRVAAGVDGVARPPAQATGTGSRSSGRHSRTSPTPLRPRHGNIMTEWVAGGAAQGFGNHNPLFRLHRRARPACTHARPSAPLQSIRCTQEQHQRGRFWSPGVG